MAELNLSEGAIGNEGAEHLGSCISKIAELKLKFCNITAPGVDRLSMSIAQYPVSGNVKLDVGLNDTF